MGTKGTLIVYPDVRWIPPKTFAELEQVGLVYKFYNFVDTDDIDFVQALMEWVRVDSDTYDYWTARLIPNAG